MKDLIQITIPAHLSKDFNKIMEKAAKKIDGLDWNVGTPYKATFRHATNEGIVKHQHNVVDVEFYIPREHDWQVVASIVDGALFVIDKSKKLVLQGEHGVDYHICDVCKHRQFKQSYIVRNTKTGEELQVGRECAKKFGIGTAQAIYSLTHELYADWSVRCSDPDEDCPMWNARVSDPYSCRSVEVSVLIQAAKKYYDDNGGKWKKSSYDRYSYTPSESAIAIRESLNDFEPCEDDAYCKALRSWLQEHFEAYSDFDKAIKDVGESYYMSAQEVGAAFFAIKKYEAWKVLEENKRQGKYVPRVNDYIYILGDVISKSTKEGYFGSYTEYEIKNEIDGLTYKRAGVLPRNKDGKVEGYAYIDNVWDNVYKLCRVTKSRKKNIEIANEYCIKH